MKPTIGRIVHYTNLGDKDGKYPPNIQAAVITRVYRKDPATGEPIPANTPGEKAELNMVDLKVFYPTGLFDTVKVPYSEAPARGHWNWPPRD